MEWSVIIKVQSPIARKRYRIEEKGAIGMSKVYTAEERSEALKLAGEIGTRPAAERLGINIDTLYTWQSKARAKARKHEEIVSAKTPEEYAAENEHLKTALKEKEDEILVLQDALSFFVKRRKK